MSPAEIRPQRAGHRVAAGALDVRKRRRCGKQRVGELLLRTTTYVRTTRVAVYLLLQVV